MFLTKDKKSTLIKLFFSTAILTILIFSWIFNYITKNIQYKTVEIGVFVLWLFIGLGEYWIALLSIIIQICVLIMIKKGRNEGITFKIWKILTFNWNKEKDEFYNNIQNSSIAPTNSFIYYVKNKRNVILLLVCCLLYMMSFLLKFPQTVENTKQLKNYEEAITYIVKIIHEVLILIFIISLFVKNLIVFKARKHLNNNRKIIEFKHFYLKLTFRKITITEIGKNQDCIN